MHIRELSCFAVEIPTQSDEYVMSRGRVLTSFPRTVVKVVADDGTTGYGEACTLGSNYLDGFPASAREAGRLLADSWVFECDVFEPNVLVDGMDALMIGNRTAKAAIDIAMWDVRGKLLGRPVAQLLGGIKQRTFPAFKAISIDTPTGDGARGDQGRGLRLPLVADQARRGSDSGRGQDAGGRGRGSGRLVVHHQRREHRLDGRAGAPIQQRHRVDRQGHRAAVRDHRRARPPAQDRAPAPDGR